jgi:hypothetical protein
MSLHDHTLHREGGRTVELRIFHFFFIAQILFLFSSLLTIVQTRSDMTNGYVYISAARRYSLCNFYRSAFLDLKSRLLFKSYSKFLVLFSFIRQWLYSLLLCPGLFFSFVIFFTQTLELLGRVISPSQGRYTLDNTIPAFQRATRVHALDRAATVIGLVLFFIRQYSQS